MISRPYLISFFFFLVAVIIVINSPYDATGFEYGQDTIFGSFQANLLVATIILSGFVSMFLWPLARWFQFLVSTFTLLLIFASFCWIFFHDLNSRAFVTYTIASNHTVSIRGEFINQGIVEIVFPQSIISVLHGVKVS